jgi:hypothetical protein
MIHKSREVVFMKYDLVLLHAPSVFDFRKNPLLAGPRYEDIKSKIEKSMAYIEKIDHLLALPKEQQTADLEKIHREIKELNSYSICGKNE